TVIGINGNQALQLTTLTPAGQPGPTMKVVNEQTSSTDPSTDAQYRLEETPTGPAQGYLIKVLEARDATGASLTPTLTETATTFTITLTDPSGKTAVITLNKGMSSSGGSFGYSASGTPTTQTPLTNSVQQVQVSTNGPVWS